MHYDEHLDMFSSMKRFLVRPMLPVQTPALFKAGDVMIVAGNNGRATLTQRRLVFDVQFTLALGWENRPTTLCTWWKFTIMRYTVPR